MGAFPRTCGRAQRQAFRLANQAGAFTRPNAGGSATGTAVREADTLKTTLTQLRSQTTSAPKRTQIGQYRSTVARYTQSVRTYASS